MKNLLVIFACCMFSPLGFAQNATEWLAGLPQARDYVQKRASSYDRSGGNADYRRIAPGETLVLMDERGPGEITHFWTTMWAEGPALKALVLRMYWDEETTPSVESPLGDFFGLGLGDYVIYESAPLNVAPNRALNSFFPMPFQKHARITVTNEGSKPVGSFYFNIDYRAYPRLCRPICSIFTRNTGRRRRTMAGRISGNLTATKSWKTKRIRTARIITFGWKRKGAGILPA